MSAPKPFGRRFWVWHDRAKIDPKAAHQLRIKFQAAWDTGDAEVRSNVLTYLASQPAEVGITCVREAVRGHDRDLVGTGVVCYTFYAHAGYGFEPEDIAILKAVMVNWNTPASARGLARHALKDGKVRGLMPLLRRIASEDPSAYNRFYANLDLLRRGRLEIKAALFKAMSEYRGEYYFENPNEAASSLWYHRELLDLTPDELEKICALILQKMQKLREQAREYGEMYGHDYGHPSALNLFHWIEKGFAYQESDVDLLGAAAFLDRDVEEQVEAVKGIAWFANDRARYLLSELVAWSKEPKVRREAKRQFQKLSSPDPKTAH